MHQHRQGCESVTWLIRFLWDSLAQAEMSLALAVLYRPNGPRFELFETDESDVRQVHDFLIPLPKLDTNGVRILIP